MKKWRLFFIALLYASISLSIRSAQLSREQATFSLKNSNKSGSIFYIVVYNHWLASNAGLLKPGELVDGNFNTDAITRLYIWEGNLTNWTSPELRKKLKSTAIEQHGTNIDEMDFAFKPNFFFKFPENKTMHVKWKQGKLQPREGRSKFAPRKGMGKYTEKERYALKNNLTEKDIKDSYWVFDNKEGRWLNSEIIIKENLSSFNG